jgi:Na+:H+ antiporter, NhaA family
VSLPSRRLFARGSFLESSRVADVLRAESIGGALVMVAALAAFAWANSPWDGSYDALRDLTIGPGSLHLDLSLGTWAADGLLAIFFFVAGLELKREFVAGDLRDPRRAALPVAAAVGGMVVPALIYVAVNAPAGDLTGWAVPTATDIAFAVAVLAVISTHLPSGLRTFLLTLAVVDDLLAITVIAVFYTDDLRASYLLLALLPIAVFGLLVQRRVSHPLLLVPLALVAWALVHESGVHATVAGVLLGFTVPVINAHRPTAKGLAERLEHLVRPLSAGVAVPVFAFFAAGVPLGGWSGLGEAVREPIALGVIAGLVLGKPVGILAATWLVHTFTHADLDEELAWSDVVGLAMLAGIGFTVSLLIGELAYPAGHEAAEDVKVGVILGSVVSAVIAGAVLRQRNRVYRRLCALEEQDSDHDGVPDAFEDPSDDLTPDR